MKLPARFRNAAAVSAYRNRMKTQDRTSTVDFVNTQESLSRVQAGTLVGVASWRGVACSAPRSAIISLASLRAEGAVMLLSSRDHRGLNWPLRISTQHTNNRRSSARNPKRSRDPNNTARGDGAHSDRWRAQSQRRLPPKPAAGHAERQLPAKIYKNGSMCYSSGGQYPYPGGAAFALHGGLGVC